MTEAVKIAIACQGGGSHCAYTGGVLGALLRRVEVDDAGRLLLDDGRYQITGLTGTSGGAISAYLAWLDLLRLRAGRLDAGALQQPLAVERFWQDNGAHLFAPPPFDLVSNYWGVLWARLEGFVPQPTTAHTPAGSLVQLRLLDMICEAAGLHDPDSLPWPADTALGGLPCQAAKRLGAAPQERPLLIVGAAHVCAGEFQPFVATPTQPPLPEQVLASTALPTLFPAVRVKPHASAPEQDGNLADGDDYAYWDGLFSQNPPISTLMLPEAAEAKPDEIWIVRINPARTPRVPVSPSDIADRRNELAGNLSLEQEKSFVRKINGMLAKGEISEAARTRYKRIDIWGLALEGRPDVPEWLEPDFPPALEPAADQRMLDYSSKLLRDPGFLHGLMDRGAQAATAFLDYRRGVRPPPRPTATARTRRR